MVTGLWPALAAVLLGRRHGGFEAGELFGVAWTADGSVSVGIEALYWFIGLLCFVLLAHATNPSDASFRTHLTDLSFHLHLRRLRASDPASSNAVEQPFNAPGSFVNHAPSTSSSGTSTPHVGKGKRVSEGYVSAQENPVNRFENGHCTVDEASKPRQTGIGEAVSASSHTTHNKRSHVLSFSNRVTISLKTPMYQRTNYGIFTIVHIPQTSAQTTSASNKRNTGKLVQSSTGKKMRMVSGSNRKISGNNSARDTAAQTSAHSGKFASIAAVAQVLSARLAAINPWAERGGLFIGFMGYWWTIDDGTSTNGQREAARLNRAVIGVGQHDDEAEDTATAPKSVPAKHAVASKADHAVQRFDDNVIDNTESTNPEISDHTANNGSSTNHVAPFAVQRQKTLQRIAATGNAGSAVPTPFRGGQRRSSPTPRAIGQPKDRKRGPDAATSETAAADDAIESRQEAVAVSSRIVNGATVSVTDSGDRSSETSASNALAVVPKIVGVKKEDEDKNNVQTVSLTASAPEAAINSVSPVCALLQNQLDELRAASLATQTKLEAELEEIRARKRDEDVVRGDLKTRTKSLEEAKRAAEQERLEAEKKLISARVVKKSSEDRVSKAKIELSKLEKKEKESDERMRKGQVERGEKLATLRQQVKQREELLAKEDEATERLASRVDALEAEIQSRRAELQTLREEAGAAARLRSSTNRAATAAAAAAAASTRSHIASASSPNLSGILDGSPNPYGNVGYYNNVQMPVHSHTVLPYPEDAVRPPSPNQVRTDYATAGHGSSQPAYGSLFDNIQYADHQLHHRRALTGASLASSLGSAGSLPSLSTTSSLSSGTRPSIVSNAAATASALYNRQFATPASSDLLSSGRNNVLDDINSPPLAYESSFAPFGPSPSSPPPTAYTNGVQTSPPVPQVSHFTAETSTHPHFSPAVGSHPHSIASRDVFKTGTDAAQPYSAVVVSSPPQRDAPVTYHYSPTRLDTNINRKGSLSTGQTRTDYTLSQVSAGEESRQSISPQYDPPAGSIHMHRGASYESNGSTATSYGGPLSPMTPHQASLIPSHLFDLLDESELPSSPASPTTASSGNDYVSGLHHVNFAAFASGIDSLIGDEPRLVAPHQRSNQTRLASDGSPTSHQSRRFSSAGHAAWDSVENAESGTIGGLSRQSSLALKRKRLSGSASAGTGVVNNGDAASILANHGQMIASPTTSSSSGSASPAILHSGSGYTSGATLVKTNSGSNHTYSQPANAFPNYAGESTLLFDKARAALALNPDAKAFRFNRPLPAGSNGSSGNTTSPHMYDGAAFGSDATRLAFESGGNASVTAAKSAATGTATTDHVSAWASPSLTHRSSALNLAGASLGGGVSSGTRVNTGNGTAQQTSGSFSPFDDDDLLRGW